MNLNRCFLLYSLALILPLAASISIAQQTEDVTPGVTPEEQNAVPEPNAEPAATNSKNTDTASTPTTSRFSPTEKIHADDAVSFPVDI